MSKLTVALVQSRLAWESPDENLAMLSEKILSLDRDVDVVALPEMFSTGFTMSVESIYEEPYGRTHRWMAEHAAKLNAGVTGSYVVREGDMYFNRLLWMHPDGSYEQYNKKHLFSPHDEDKHFTKGNSRTIVDFRGWKILPLICYDLRFPAWSRNHYRESTGELDYDLLLYTANWPNARLEAWDTLLKGRAIENHCFSAGVNCFGKDGNNIEYYGHSGVYDPRGEQLAFSDKEEEMIVTLDKDFLESYRKGFPAYLDSID